jgi:hypothetical protein
MVWLILIAVWGAAAIVVAVIWGRLVHRGQSSDDERLATPPAADSDARPEVPPADSDHWCSCAGRHMSVMTEP